MSLFCVFFSYVMILFVLVVGIRILGSIIMLKIEMFYVSNVFYMCHDFIFVRNYLFVCTNAFKIGWKKNGKFFRIFFVDLIVI